MNYKLSTTLQWTLILISGAVALKMGKQYGRQQADDMNHEYSDATTKGDIAKAIASYNEDLDQQESSQVMASK